MCKFWKPEKCNHHFPELNKKKGISRMAAVFFTPSRLSIIMIVVAVVMGMTYMMQTNGAATQGYQIKDLEKRSTELKKENETLNLQYIELQSMASVVNRVASLNLVAMGDIEVVNPAGSSVALR